MIDRVGRVAVPVGDQDRAIEFYVERLGFSVVSDEAYSDGSYRWVEVAPPGGGTTLAIVTPRPGGAVGIETNVILTTTDIDEAHAALRDRGVDVDAEVSHMGDRCRPWSVPGPGRKHPTARRGACGAVTPRSGTPDVARRFITGPDDAMEWAFELGEPSDLADEVRDAPARSSRGDRAEDQGDQISVRYRVKR